jgi:hypothetical protein
MDAQTHLKFAVGLEFVNVSIHGLGSSLQHVQAHKTYPEDDYRDELDAIHDHMRDEGFDVSWLVIVAEYLRAASHLFSRQNVKG